MISEKSIYMFALSAPNPATLRETGELPPLAAAAVQCTARRMWPLWRTLPLAELRRARASSGRLTRAASCASRISRAPVLH